MQLPSISHTSIRAGLIALLLVASVLGGLLAVEAASSKTGTDVPSLFAFGGDGAGDGGSAGGDGDGGGCCGGGSDDGGPGPGPGPGDGDGNPPPPVDVCPNLGGIQTSIPGGMIFENGNCVNPPPPPPPVVPRPSAPGLSYVCAPSGTGVTFNFFSPGATHYYLRFDIDMSQPHIDTIDGYTSTSWTKNGITPGQNYVFWVHAGNGGGNWATDISAETSVQFNCPAPVPPAVDFCPNIPGAQPGVPPGMILDASGNCVTPPVTTPDMCPNIAGTQTSVPAGLIVDSSGNCVAPPVSPADICPNIAGTQTSIPAGMIFDASGNCVTPIIAPVDMCPNIAGTQTSVPAGLIVDASGNCVAPPLSPTDMCPNIAGTQTTVPAGLVIDASGNCVTPPVTPIVCTLTPSATTVAPGGTSTLTWTSTGAASATLNGSPITVNGSQTVTVNANTTYTAVFTGPAGTITCTATITVTTPPIPSGGGGGGGLNAPNVSLFRKPGEQPLAFVTLSQIPYTGYETGPLGVALFWMLLVGFSAVVAYLIIVKRLPQRFVERYVAATSVVSMPHIDASNEHVEMRAPAMTHVSSVKPSPIKVMRSILAPERAAYAPALHTAVVGVRSAAHATISEPEVVRTPVAVASSRTSEASDYVSAVPLFIGWVARGESEKAFDFLRNLSLTKQSAKDFMEKAVCELDDAYRCRVDNTGAPNEHTTAAIANLSNSELEKLIEALASAVDRSYGSDYTSAKVALVKALGVKGSAIDAAAHKPETRAEAPQAAIPAAQAYALKTDAPDSVQKQKRTQDYVDDFILAQIARRAR